MGGERMLEIKNKNAMKGITLIYLMLLVASVSFAQGNERMLVGVIMDSKTESPLGGAVLHTAKHNLVSDDNGRVTATVDVGDVVYVTHVGYQTARIEIADTLAYQNLFGVFMTEDTLQLAEVVVKARQVDLTLMSHTMQLNKSYEDEIMKNNVLNAVNDAKYLSSGAMDASATQASQIMVL